jgi:hypothetical protein
MTPPFKIEGQLHRDLKHFVERIAEQVWERTDGEDWINDPVDVETVQVILEEWMVKHFDRIVGDKLDELVDAREEEEERERREEEKTQRELTAWL